MTMSKQEAADYCVNLRNQKLTYPAISEALAKAGYVSEKTKRPLGAIAVRSLVMETVKEDEKEIQQQMARFKAGTPILDKLEAVKVVAKISGLDADKKLKLVLSILD